MCARGNSEDPFAEADLLYSEKRYAEAIALLKQILLDDPELFDDAQPRYNIYLEIKRRISDLEEGIVDDIKDENPAGIFEKIGLIMELEPYPDDIRAAVLDDYRYEAGTIVNIGVVNEIMDRALILLAEDQYWDAVALYSTGLDIGRTIFEDTGYDSITTGTVMAARDGVEASAGAFVADQARLESAVGKLNDDFKNGSVAAVSAGVDELYDNLVELLNLRAAVSSYAQRIQETRTGLRQIRDDNRDIAYLRYLGTLVSGREGVEGEGIIAVMEGVWDESWRNLDVQAISFLRGLFESGQTAFGNRDWDDATERYEAVIAAAPVTTKALSLRSALVAPDEGYGFSGDEKAFIDETIDLFLYASGRERIAAQYLDAIPRLARAESIDVNLAFDPVGTLQARRREIESTLASLGEAIASVDSGAEHFLGIAASGVDAAEEIELFVELGALLASTAADARRLDISIASRIADVRIGELVTRFDPFEERTEEARKLVEGTLYSSAGREVPADASEEERAQAILKRYPDQGRIALLGIRGDLGSFQRTTDTVVATLGVDKNYVLADDGVTSSLAKGAGLQSRIRSLDSQLNELIAQALEEIRLAEEFRDQAYTYLDNAERAIASDNFVNGQNYLTAATRSMLESISHQQNDAFAAEIDSRVAALTEGINRQAIATDIQEVNELVAAAQQSFGRQEYESAEGSLLSAQARWATINTNPDAVIEHWLAVVQAAMSVQVGLQISETDPTYREMRQYLNFALADYSEAEQLLEDNDRVGALKKLEEVETSLRVVLQRYPNNEEANLLNWWITKIEDIDKYNREIRDLINAARRDVDTPSVAEAYRNLQTIRKLEPDEPEIADLIYQAEITLGLRAPPKTEETVNLAAILYEEALELYESGDETQLDAALDRLSEAIIIDSGYDAAKELRNTINTERGGYVTNTLATTEDLQFFLQAVKLFQEEQAGQALIIIIRLWSNPDNRNYEALIDLRAKVYRATGA